MTSPSSANDLLLVAECRVYCRHCGHSFLVASAGLLGVDVRQCEVCDRPIPFSWGEHGAD